jgi:hypothetical protein
LIVERHLHGVGAELLQLDRGQIQFLFRGFAIVVPIDLDQFGGIGHRKAERDLKPVRVEPNGGRAQPRIMRQDRGSRQQNRCTNYSGESARRK